MFGSDMYNIFKRFCRFKRLRILSFVGFEVFFAHEAEWAGPVVGELFEWGSGWDAVLGISCGGVVYPVAYGALILLHDGDGG